MPLSTPARSLSVDAKAWLILTGLALTWGSSYILMKKALEDFGGVEVAALRISISGLAFAPVLLRYGREVDWRKSGLLFFVGLTGTAIPSFCFAIALTRLNSSLGGVLSSLTPLLTLVVAALFFRQRIERGRSLGILVGLAGAGILFGFQPGGLSGDFGFALLVVLATLCYAISSNTVAYRLRHMRSLTISASSFFLVGLLGVPYLFFGTDFLPMLRADPHAWVSLGYVALLALAGTVLASVFFYQLVFLKDAVFASIVSYLIPVVALMWGAIDGETIYPYQLAGLALILAGVYLTKK